MPADQPPARRRGDGPHDLRDHDTFRWLAGQVRQHDALDQRLREVLPESLRQQVHLAGAKDGRLLFIVPSPAWAMRLRTLQVSILVAARHAGIQAHTVATRVAAVESRPEPEPARGTPLSATAAEHLRRAARTLPDAELREALLKLAATADAPDSRRRTT